MPITDYISNSGMSIEQKADIEQNIKRYVKDFVPTYDRYFEPKAYVPGHKTYSYRKSVRPEVVASMLATGGVFAPLTEGVGTRASNVKIIEKVFEVSDYGTHIKYTREQLKYNFDDVRSLAIDNFEVYATEVPEQLKLAALIATPFQMTTATTITETLDKALVIFKKKKNKPVSGDGLFDLIVTPEVIAQLKAELRAKGETLDTDTKYSVTVNGTVYNYNGFHLIEKADDALYHKTAEGKVDGYNCLVIGKDRNGALPGKKMDPEIEIEDKGLGTGLISDPTSPTTWVEDTNNRAGSLHINIDHNYAGIQNPVAVLGFEWSTLFNAAPSADADDTTGATSTNVAPSTPSGVQPF